MIPPYPKRVGWVPQTQEDFDGGGAYPEIHAAQFPANAGRGIPGNVLVQQKILVPRPENQIAERPNPAHVQDLAEETAKALQLVRWKQASHSQLKRAEASLKAVDKYVRYVPDPSAPGYDPTIKERIVRVVDKQIDPLEPSKFKCRRAPAPNTEEPTPILRPPPKKLTPAEREAWSIPPSISNWINPAGHTLPLEMRIQADRRNMQEVVINPNFASLSEALYVAERVAREELKLKQDLLKQKAQHEEAQREERLRDLAAQARKERAQLLGRDNELKESQSPIKEESSPSHSLIEERINNDSPAEAHMHQTQHRYISPPKTHFNHNANFLLNSNSTDKNNNPKPREVSISPPRSRRLPKVPSTVDDLSGLQSQSSSKLERTNHKDIHDRESVHQTEQSATSGNSLPVPERSNNNNNNDDGVSMVNERGRIPRDRSADNEIGYDQSLGRYKHDFNRSRPTERDNRHKSHNSRKWREDHEQNSGRGETLRRTRRRSPSDSFSEGTSLSPRKGSDAGRNRDYDRYGKTQKLSTHYRTNQRDLQRRDSDSSVDRHHVYRDDDRRNRRRSSHEHHADKDTSSHRDTRHRADRECARREYRDDSDIDVRDRNGKKRDRQGNDDVQNVNGEYSKSKSKSTGQLVKTKLTELEMLETERRREIVREVRLERAKLKSKRPRVNAERDISEKVALGQAEATQQETMYDARLFNRNDNNGPEMIDPEEEEYAIYQGDLFEKKASGLYHFDKERIRNNIGNLEFVSAEEGGRNTNSSMI